MSRLSRRGLLGSAAVAAAAVPAVAAARACPEPDAELRALVRRWHELEHELHTPPIFADAAHDDAWTGERYDAQWEALTAIQAIRPRTIEGCMAKATVALATYENMNKGLELDDLEQFIMATLRDCAGKAPVTFRDAAALTVEVTA